MISAETVLSLVFFALLLAYLFYGVRWHGRRDAILWLIMLASFVGLLLAIAFAHYLLAVLCAVVLGLATYKRQGRTNR